MSDLRDDFAREIQMAEGRRHRRNRWEAFSQEELSMIIGALRRSNRSRYRMVDEMLYGPHAPLLRELSKELRCRQAAKPS